MKMELKNLLYRLLTVKVRSNRTSRDDQNDAIRHTKSLLWEDYRLIDRYIPFLRPEYPCSSRRRCWYIFLFYRSTSPHF